MANQSSTPEGDQLRARAIEKLSQARTLIDSARQDLCNLEGHGYCKQYLTLRTLYDKTEEHMRKLRGLKPPTGIFKI